MNVSSKLFNIGVGFFSMYGGYTLGSDGFRRGVGVSEKIKYTSIGVVTGTFFGCLFGIVAPIALPISGFAIAGNHGIEKYKSFYTTMVILPEECPIDRTVSTISFRL